MFLSITATEPRSDLCPQLLTYAIALSPHDDPCCSEKNNDRKIEVDSCKQCRQVGYANINIFINLLAFLHVDIQLDTERGSFVFFSTFKLKQ